MASGMADILAGIRVLDWGAFYAGPAASAILGDLGAEVIKLEEPGRGDPTRPAPHYGKASFATPDGTNLFFEAANRNKLSVTVDLNKEAGREVVYRLVANCDVFSTNIRRMGRETKQMTYQVLSRYNPRLIYAVVSGFGPKGPDSDVGAFDIQGQARSGLMLAMGEPDMPPQVVQFGVIDQATAIMASYSIVLALLMRERTGQGQEVHTSLLSTSLYLQYCNLLHALILGRDVPRFNRRDTDVTRNYYRCRDGEWLFVTVPPRWQNGWQVFCNSLGHPELVSDPRFDTREKRMQHAGELTGIIDGIFAARTRDEWRRVLSAFDYPFAPVNRQTDLEHDRQIVENDYVVDFDHPRMGKVKIPGFPFHFSASSPRTRAAAPGVGEHTEEVLMRVGGYSAAEVARLKRDGVI